jgi:2-polyprenyl-3-methyl-5-hydroxy-6-metoxy-1,4-benzoquinol methylase
MKTATGWNHNAHYHSVILRALPARCERVLDVGCGTGELCLRLRDRVEQVVGIDADAATLTHARTFAAASNVHYVLGDFLTYDFQPASFDAVTCVAALHHLGTRVGLARMTPLVRPGGVLVAIGLARSSRLRDYGYDVAGTIATRARRLTTEWSETVAPTTRPNETYREIQQAVREQLPGARYRRHTLFRYEVVWSRPTG